MDGLYSLFLLAGGIALFLYGISFMTSSLMNAAGDNLRIVLEKATSKGLFAVLVGTFVTALIQSSGACGVMVVGFVNASLMSLSQALYVMLGANIGTTITSQIIAFDITGIAPLILFIGMVLYMFVKNRTLNKIGGIVLGFGMLFVGIYLMGDATDKLNLGVVIEAFLSHFSNPLILVLFGFVFTAIIQSSSASVGILQVLAISAPTLTLGSVFYLILGMNIGACSPIIIASFGANRASKRTALANIVTKVLGVLIFTVVALIFPNLVHLIEGISPNEVPRQIANMHLLFNLVSSLALCPFVPLISRTLEKFMPDKPESEIHEKKFVYLNPSIAMTPSVAVVQSKQEILRMAKLSYENLENAIKAFFSPDENIIEDIFKIEDTINYLNHSVTSFLVTLHGKALTDREREKVGMMFRVVSDIERIGDHAENIAEYARMIAKNSVSFSPEAQLELEDISSKTLHMVKLSTEIFENEWFDRLEEAHDLEEEVDVLQETLTENHIARLKKDSCDPRGGIIFTDIVTDLERCSDHAINIAFSIKGETSTLEMKKAYIISRGGFND